MITRDLFDIPVLSITRDEIVNYCKKLIISPGKKTFFYINAHCVNLTKKDATYKKILQAASFVYSGGIGPIIASRILGKPLKERTPTPDFIFDIFTLAQEKKWSLYLLGASNESIKKTTIIIKKQFPKLALYGYHHGFFSRVEEKKIIKEINSKKPTILLVGMGTPKQEKWIFKYKEKLNAKVFWAVGALFDVLSGTAPRAPKWMQKIGLEWFYRFLKEPKRMWKRYIYGNCRFILYIFENIHKAIK